MNLKQLKFSTPESRLEQAKSSGNISKKYLHPGHKGAESDQEFVQNLRHLALNPQFVEVLDNAQEKKYVEFSAQGPILNEFGEFSLIIAQVVGGGWGKHYILVYPEIDKVLQNSEVFCRIESGCHSGFVFADNTCDCKEQLHLAMQKIVGRGSGIIFQIHEQDGRGWGDWKMYNQKIMQETGLNTVETAKAFYQDEPFDIRTYDDMALILKALGFDSSHTLELGTNNFQKLNDLTKHGFKVSNQETLIAKNLNESAQKNLDAKTQYYSTPKN